MSVDSVSSTSSDYWLQRLMATYAQQSSTTSQSSALSLLSQGSDATDATSATSSDSSSSSSVGSFNDILTALLNGGSGLSYDMDTGSLTTASQGEEGDMPPPPMDGAQGADGQGQGLTRAETTTTNADGSTTTNATLTDADGNQVGTETTTTNTDGSYTTTLTMTDPSGKTSTRTITGENTADGFKETQTLTDVDGNILETGTILTAADGSVTTSMTRNGPDGSSMSESESYDADGNLVSATTSSTAATSASSAASGTASSTSASSASGSSGSGSGGSSGSSSSDETTTTITMSYDTTGITETTTVTDADGNIVSQQTKQIATNTGKSGSSASSDGAAAPGSLTDDLTDKLSQFMANRYSQYADQAALDLGAQSSGVSVEA